jgi:hypothetical protein
VAHSYIKITLMDLKAQIDPNTMIVGNLNIPLSQIDRSYKQNVRKETSELMHIFYQMDIIDIYREFHPTTM